MKVNPSDGRCRNCAGELEVTDADDCCMSVICAECGDEYLVEPDAFNDRASTYYPAIVARKLAKGDDA